MINRWIGIVALGLMLSVNTALVLRDFFPRWTAGDPPHSKALSLPAGQATELQYGIFNNEGRRIGYSWTRSSRNEEITSIHHSTMLNGDALPVALKTQSMRIDTTLIYRGNDQIDEIRVTIYGVGMTIRLEGELFPPDDFACRWQIGEERGDFVIPGRFTRSLGDIIRPFDSLTELTVGQSWRIELLNPMTGLFSKLGASDMSNESVYVHVDRLETIEHRGRQVDAFVLVSDRLRAWVNHKGDILRQEIDLPLLGTLTLVDEPFDNRLRETELQRSFQD